MLRFPYRPELVGVALRWRPLTRVEIIAPLGRRRYKALLDPGSDDTIFPLAIARRIGVTLRPETGETLRWRGQRYPLRFGNVDLELTDNIAVLRWPAIVGFSAAPIPYVLLGTRGCLQFFDVTFRGDNRIVEIEPNRAYPGTT